MASLWEDRDLPILKVILGFEATGWWPDQIGLHDWLEDEGYPFDSQDIMLSLHALADAEPPFIRARFGDMDQPSPDGSAEDVRLTERGFRAVGAWPSADPYDQLMKLLSERIDAEDQPEVKGKLERFRESLQGIGRDVVVGVLTSLARQSAGLP
jgi:hypothetical protein